MGTLRGPSFNDCQGRSNVRTLVFSVLIFVASALAGPLIRFAMWPPSKLEQGFSIGDFVYDLVLLLWPTQPLAVIEVSVGAFLAVAVSVGANILLFAAAGIVAGISASWPARLLSVYLAICVMLLILALWSAGFSFAHLNMIALSVAFVLYAFPFWAVFRLAEKSRIAGAKFGEQSGPGVNNTL